MKTIGEKLEAFKVIGVKPGFNNHEENGQSAFAEVLSSSCATPERISSRSDSL